MFDSISRNREALAAMLRVSIARHEGATREVRERMLAALVMSECPDCGGHGIACYDGENTGPCHCPAGEGRR